MCGRLLVTTATRPIISVLIAILARFRAFPVAGKLLTEGVRPMALGTVVLGVGGCVVVGAIVVVAAVVVAAVVVVVVLVVVVVI